MRTCSRRMLQRDEAIIVRFDALTAAIQLCVYGHSRAEEGEGLIDEMTAEVIQQSTRFGGIGLFTPTTLWGGSPPLEARLEAHDVTEQAVSRKAPHGAEVAVPAAILVDGEE